jgi:S-(hydroxymethyl)glutathione dehydrogenase / alcohol dehydrogenase
MKAAVLTEFGRPLELLDLQVAEPSPHEVLIRVAACGVCHSDLNVALGNLPASPRPQVLGHEAAGVVERVGDAVTALHPGDHVITCPAAFCGTCSWCMSGLLHLCTDKQRARAPGAAPRLSLDGRPVAQFVGLGGFAERMLVHERAVATVPEQMPLDRAALLGCSVITGMGSVINTAGVRPGDTVAVIGCGGVGLNAVQAARFCGASVIVAVDRVEAKLDRARLFGATHAVDASRHDPVEQVRELTQGGVDHAFEVVGRPPTIEQAFAMLRPRGTATVVGVARPSDRVSVPALELLSEKRLQGTQMGSSRFRLDAALFARLYLDGRIMLDELISQRIPLDQANKALATLDDFPGARSVITFES